MSRPDATASAAMGNKVIRPVFFVYLDILGDPVRGCTAGKSYLLTGTGDPDFDGHQFDGLNPQMVDVGPVHAKAGGSDSVQAKLSGLVGIDDALLAAIGNPANWRGRTARLWRMIRDIDGVQQGVVQHYWTGWMTALTIAGSPDNQMIQLTIEGYLASFSQASNRTYLDQDQFDPGDLSAKAAIALANGDSSNQLVNSTPVVPGVSGAQISGNARYGRMIDG